MKPIHALCALLAVTLAAPAGAEKPDAKAPAAKGEAKAKVAATDFIRVEQDEKAARLQTAVTRYEKNGIAVDLIGAVHIADKKYYEALNKTFDNYEALLFEMIGGENMVDGKIERPEGDEGDLQSQVLRQLTGGMARFLELSGQLDEVDYTKKHFVHADLTLKQFAKKQDERGESIFSFAFAAAQNGENKGVEQPNMARLLAAILSGDSNALKLEMLTSLGMGDDQIATLAGENVIIGDRNAKCMKILRKQVKAGKKSLGIFYGAAHFADMEARLLKMGYKQTKQEWMTAWDVPKPEKKEEKAPEDKADAEKLKKAA